MTPEQMKFSEEIASARRGRLEGPYSIWIRIPELADTANHFSNAIRLHGKLDKRLYELMVAIITRHWSAQYAWFSHLRQGIAAGLSPDVYEALRTRCAPNFVREDERLVYDVVNEILETKTLRQDSYDRAIRILGLNNLIELVTGIGFYTTISVVLNAFDVPVPDIYREGNLPL